MMKFDERNDIKITQKELTIPPLYHFEKSKYSASIKIERI